MKRTRKLTIEVEKREITVSINLEAGSWGDAGFGSSTSGPVRTSGPLDTTESCPFCGFYGMLPIADALSSCRGGGQLALSQAMIGGSIHIARLGIGLWVCQNSLETFLAKAVADSKETHE